MASTDVTPEAVPVEDVEVDLEAKSKEFESESEGSRANSGEYRLTTDIKNFSKSRVHVLETHFWHGRAVSNGFPPLPVNTGVALRQIGTLPEGVKWGIAYTDGDDSTARRFVVAVHAPTGKIYAEAGPIGPIDWNVIEVKLDRYAGSKTDVTDHILGGRIVAEINGSYSYAKFYN